MLVPSVFVWGFIFMRDSTIFYRSFYEAIKELDSVTQAQVYNAIFEYSLNFREVELDGLAKTIFTLIKPQLQANINKYHNGKNPKSKQEKSKTEAKDKQTESKTEANVNVNDNKKDNVNVKDKVKDKDILLNNTYQLCVDFWLKEFHPDFTFNATAGNKLKSIIKKFETLLKNNGKEITVSTLFESFKIMCNKLPEWYKNKDLSIIDSKFNEIIQEIKNGTNSKQEQRKDAAAEAIRLLTGTELR